MKKIIYCIGILFCLSTASAQNGIGTTTPKTTLHIEGEATDTSKADGLKIPSLTLAQLEAKMSATTYSLDQDGVMVYVNDTSAASTLTETAGVLNNGLYIFSHDGTSGSWRAAGENKLWSIRGNTGTSQTTDFIGTTDNVPLIFKVNNIQSGRIGIGSDRSVFLGFEAGLSDNLLSHWNTFIGYQSGKATTLGLDNTATGYRSLTLNTQGSRNSAFGSFALQDNTIGSNNVASGYQSLSDNTIGNDNVAIGFNSLRSNTEGIRNIAIGSQTLENNIEGNLNIAIGYNAMVANTFGTYNIAIGESALYFNEVSNNIAIGKRAMYSNTNGLDNTAVGLEALAGNTLGNYNTAIGFQALNQNFQSSNNTAIGYRSMLNNTNGENNTANGYLSMLVNTTGGNNVAMGYLSLLSNTTGSSNVAIGYEALESNTIGSLNTSVGYQSLKNNTNQSGHSAFGFQALVNNTSGDNNTGIGYKSLQSNSTGDDNVAVGYVSLERNTSGNNNTAIGYAALQDNTTGFRNVAVGRSALANNTTGFDNVVLGFGASTSSTAFSNTISIGFSAQPNASNVARIGNTVTNTIGGYANWTNVSDGRFKQNIKENIAGLAFIKKLRPVSYQLDMEALARFNKTPDSLRLRNAEKLKAAEIQTGFIAQEVEQAAQEVGFDFHGVDKPKNEQSHYGLRYAEFVVPLVKAVQEQQEEIEALKTKQEILLKELKQQHANTTTLENLINKQQKQIQLLLNELKKE